jgi:peptidyl-prolyl cis-trans isomerase B (cyclophilin B)
MRYEPKTSSVSRRYAGCALRYAILSLILLLTTTSQAFLKNSRFRTFNQQEIDIMKTKTALIHTKFGDITMKFFPEVAPNHVNSFIELADSGFFDGTTFHRVVPGFVIQGGDPNSKSEDRSKHGQGGPGYTLKAEFSNLLHKRGTLSMARAANPDSAGSQFFICVADTPFLDGQYTVFGEVVDGMDVVDQIVSQPRDQGDNPVDRIEIKVEIVTPEKSE